MDLTYTSEEVDTEAVQAELKVEKGGNRFSR